MRKAAIQNSNHPFYYFGQFRLYTLTINKMSHYYCKRCSWYSKRSYLFTGDRERCTVIIINKKEIIIKHEDINKDDILLTGKPAMLQQEIPEVEHFQGVCKKDSLAG